MKPSLNQDLFGEFLDDHEEVHAFPTGVGIGAAVVLTGDERGAAVTMTLFTQFWERKRRPKARKKQDLANDIKREPHYFISGFALGVIIGIVARAQMGQTPLPELPYSQLLTEVMGSL